jgi:hypothetical protein
MIFVGTHDFTYVPAVAMPALRIESNIMLIRGQKVTKAEKAEVVANCDHLRQLKFSRTLPFAFTEHGAIQAANVLASLQAIEMGVYVVRAFVRLREMVVSNKELALRLDELENKAALIELTQDVFSRNTRAQLKQVFDAIRELMQPAEPTSKRPIGFVMPDGKKK